MTRRLKVIAVQYTGNNFTEIEDFVNSSCDKWNVLDIHRRLKIFNPHDYFYVHMYDWIVYFDVGYYKFSNREFSLLFTPI